MDVSEIPALVGNLLGGLQNECRMNAEWNTDLTTEYAFYWLCLQKECRKDTSHLTLFSFKKNRYPHKRSTHCGLYGYLAIATIHFPPPRLSQIHHKTKKCVSWRLLSACSFAHVRSRNRTEATTSTTQYKQHRS